MAVKKAKAAPSNAASAQPSALLGDQQGKSTVELGRFLSWVRSSESDDYYASLEDEEDRRAFDALVDDAYHIYFSLQNVALEKFAARARAHQEALGRAVTSIKRELDGQKRAAAIINGVGALVQLLFRVLLP